MTKANDKTRSEAQTLINKRLKMAFGLSAALLILFLGYGILLWAPEKISGSVIYGRVTLLVFTSIAVVILGVIAAGIYTWWANTKLDPELKKLRETYNVE